MRLSLIVAAAAALALAASASACAPEATSPLKGSDDDDDSYGMPDPFNRILAIATPPMNGLDVYILQNLLRRSAASATLPVTRSYDAATAAAVQAFQRSAGLAPNGGVLDVPTATALLASPLVNDGYRWNGTAAGKLGFSYLLHIPVHANRSIESNGTLYDALGNALLSFHARLHGNDVRSTPPWCSYSNGSVGLNQFSGNGATPTGLIEIDLNSPEDNATEFGPWPVNRAVKGVEGNAAFLMTNDPETMVRDGILVHTGDWAAGCGWAPPNPMPDSLGCVHVWPEELQAIYVILTQQLGVQVRPNTDGALPYPYPTQGLLAIEQVD